MSQIGPGPAGPLRLDLLDDLADQLEAEYGPVDEEQVEQAMRQWPDYEPE